MHIGFSFKPKTLLIVLAVILGIVAYGVDAFADPLDEHTSAELIPALPPLYRVSSASISLSWLPTVPVMSLPSPALPV